MTLDGLRQAISTNEKLYSSGIVFKKYRTLEALSAICEYIEAERCDKLEGENGAYNLFEQELRADRIISRLDKIQESLDAIMENQYLLYAAIKETNTKLAQIKAAINESTRAICESIDSAASEINAQLNRNQVVQEKILQTNKAIASMLQTNSHLLDAVGLMIALR